MSRNTEYQFISTDTAQIEALGKEAYERICGVPVRDASPERLFIAWYTRKGFKSNRRGRRWKIKLYVMYILHT